jgi:hypothetical protein
MQGRHAKTLNVASCMSAVCGRQAAARRVGVRKEGCEGEPRGVHQGQDRRHSEPQCNVRHPGAPFLSLCCSVIIGASQTFTSSQRGDWTPMHLISHARRLFHHLVSESCLSSPEVSEITYYEILFAGRLITRGY